MALVVSHILDPEPQHGGLLVQTPRSGKHRVGTFAEIIDESATDDISAVCADASTALSPQEFAGQEGWIQRDELSAMEEDSSVVDRLENSSPIFRHEFFGAENSKRELTSLLSLALVDGDLEGPDTGWQDDTGTPLVRFVADTSERDAESLGEMHRSLIARNADLSDFGMIEVVHPEVEAPLSLWSRYLHKDDGYSLFERGTIFQTLYSDLEGERGERFDPSKHYEQAGLIQP